MKVILLFTFLLLILSSSGQVPVAKTTIVLSVGDCRKQASFTWNQADTIRVYKLPEQTLVYKIAPNQYRYRPVRIENVQTGDYRLLYKNGYGQDVTQQHSLAQQPIDTVFLCMDALVAYPENTLAKLSGNDSLTIRFFSQGCFHVSSLKLVISKQQHKFLAQLFSCAPGCSGTNRNTLQRPDQLLKKTFMTAEHLRYFIRFENELLHLKEGGCTTTDWYCIRSRYLNVEITDAGCVWRGFDHLKKALFGDK